MNRKTIQEYIQSHSSHLSTLLLLRSHTLHSLRLAPLCLAYKIRTFQGHSQYKLYRLDLASTLYERALEIVNEVMLTLTIIIVKRLALCRVTVMRRL